MTDLLKISTEIIDNPDVDPGFIPGPTSRITRELSELSTDVAMVEAFSHCIVFRTDDGLLAFDTSGKPHAGKVVSAIRGWSSDRFNTLVYTHGHIDHVGGCGAFLADAADRGEPKPRIAGHENIAPRFDRYRLTNRYNLLINQRQFMGYAPKGQELRGINAFLPEETEAPQLVYRDRLDISVGGLDVQLHHARGETDDHTWAWIPEHKAICAGDFFIWCFPNAGNPQKVQRYPLEWAAAMRSMASQGAELFLPAHGLPIAGKGRISRVLTDVAEALETLVRDTLTLMNEGARLNDVIHSVQIPQDVLAKPYLVPLYDEPEFVVRNIWRMYGGWHDGNPAHLKPARERELAVALADLAGGAGALADKALESVDSNIRLACELVELATQAAPEDIGIHGKRAEIYQARRDRETSLMAKGIFGYAAGESMAQINAPENSKDNTRDNSSSDSSTDSSTEGG